MSGTLIATYNNLSLALSMHTDALAKLQEQVSSGSRINRASDDPSSAFRILGLNSEQKLLGNYIDNIAQSISTLDISYSVIGAISSIISGEKVNLTQIASGSYTQESRERLAEEVDGMLEQMVSLANTKYMDQYLFGGGNTSTAPYAVQRSNGEITSVTYQGSSDDRDIEVAPGVETNVFYSGDDIFRSDSRSTPIFLGDTGAAAGTGTSNVRGDVWLTVTDLGGGNYRLSIDDGVTTVDTDGTDTNLAVENAGGEVLYVDTTGIDSAGIDMVRVPGTYDIFNTFISLRNILKNDKGFSDSRVVELINSSMESLNELENYLVQKSVSMGYKIGFLESLRDSLEDIKFSTEDEAVTLQQADIAQIAIDISRREVMYQMSLSVAGRLLSLSLLDFII